jgi:hypothetical protein
MSANLSNLKKKPNVKQWSTEARNHLTAQLRRISLLRYNRHELKLAKLGKVTVVKEEELFGVSMVSRKLIHSALV